MSGAAYELAVERTFDAPRDVVWRAATDRLADWWCPQPWRSEIVALEWTNGGRFEIAMHGPGGEVHPITGVLLEVMPGERFVFTNTLDATWRPQDAKPVGIVGIFEFADLGDGRTRFRSSARHWSEADAQAHADLGFAHGWGICADQLGDVAHRLAEHADA